MNPIARFVVEIRALSRVAPPRFTIRYLVKLLTHLRAFIHARSFVAIDSRMGSALVSFRAFDTDIILPANKVGGVRELYGRAVYFRGGQPPFKKGSRILDLGANAGLFSLLAAKLGCEVLAVEAQAGFVDEIKKNAESNHLSTVRTEWALVGGETGVFSDAERRSGATHMHGKVPPRRMLSEILKDHSLQKIDFMKIDIEGSEFALFASPDVDAWLPHVRQIAMEIHSLLGDGASLISLLRSAGFSVGTTDSRLRRVDGVPKPDGYLFAIR